jgi:hypothetical protein
MEYKKILNFFFTFDGIILLLITFTFIYFIIKAKLKEKNKKYKFEGVGLENIDFKKRKIRSSESKGEKLCRAVFQRIFNKPFLKDRPDFLKNPVTGKNLELDGVNYTIKHPTGMGVAFEHDGEGHFHYNKYFHSDKNDFIYQAKKDSFKDTVCKNKGLLLIRVPYYVSQDYDTVFEYIVSRLKEERMM